MVPPPLCGGGTRVNPVTAEFFGGPFDGEVRAVQADVWGMPALYQVAWGPGAFYCASGAPGPPGSGEPVLYSYRRQVSPCDEGPLWRYLLEEQL